GVLPVVERSAVNDDAGDRVAVPADVFRGRVDDDVGAPVQRTQQVGGAHRVVDDERHAEVVRDGGNGLDVENVALGGGGGFAGEELRAVLDRAAPRFGIVGVVDEGHLDAELGQGVREEVVGPAVEGGRGDDVVAGFGNVDDREELRRLARSDEQRTHAAFERGEAILDHLLGGVG